MEVRMKHLEEKIGFLDARRQVQDEEILKLEGWWVNNPCKSLIYSNCYNNDLFNASDALEKLSDLSTNVLGRYKMLKVTQDI